MMFERIASVIFKLAMVVLAIGGLHAYFTAGGIWWLILGWWFTVCVIADATAYQTKD